MVLRIAVALVALLAGAVPAIVCQSSVKMLAVQSSAVAAHARFGWRVAAHNTWAVISSPFEEAGGSVAAGCAYLFSRDQGWKQVQRIEAPSAQAVRTFGMALALTDDLLAVGAPGDHEGELMSGAVYMYGRDGATWNLLAKVGSPEPVKGGRFGIAVDLSPNVLVVGAFRAFGSSERSGSVYVFEKDTASWRFVRELYPETSEPDEAFGMSVRLLDDSTIAVGRSMTDPLDGRKEAVAVFSRRGKSWSQTDLTVPSGGGADLFGMSLASNEHYLAVGVPGRTVGGIRAGGVAVYDRITLQPLWIVENPKAAELVNFGCSLSMTAERLYVGCVQTEGEERKPMGKVGGYDIAALAAGPSHWYPLEDQEGRPFSCPQVSATDSIVLVSSPFCDVTGIVDAGSARFYPVSGSLDVEGPSVPLEYALSQNYPNPFNAMTRINYSLKAPGKVRLELYNLLGQRVAVLVNKEMREGRYFVTVDARRYASGVYFYRITVNDFSARKKMLLVK